MYCQTKLKLHARVAQVLLPATLLLEAKPSDANVQASAPGKVSNLHKEKEKVHGETTEGVQGRGSIRVGGKRNAGHFLTSSKARTL